MALLSLRDAYSGTVEVRQRSGDIVDEKNNPSKAHVSRLFLMSPTEVLFIAPGLFSASFCRAADDDGSPVWDDSPLSPSQTKQQTIRSSSALNDAQAHMTRDRRHLQIIDRTTSSFDEERRAF